MKICLQVPTKSTDFDQSCTSGNYMVKNGSLEMFPLTENQRNADCAAFSEIISKHLKTFEHKLLFYFMSVCTESFDWMENPYSLSAAVVGLDMTCKSRRN